MVFPGFDGGGEWGGAAFDPETSLLYVNANEMAWILRLVPRDREVGLPAAIARRCHRDDRAARRRSSRRWWNRRAAIAPGDRGRSSGRARAACRGSPSLGRETIDATRATS